MSSSSARRGWGRRLGVGAGAVMLAVTGAWASAARPAAAGSPAAAHAWDTSDPGALPDPANPAGCDNLDPAECLLPFPNDYFTVADSSTDTGRRLALSPLAMPTDSAGVPIRPDEWNRADGFSPGSLIVTRVPGLDTPAAFTATGAVPQTDMARAFDPAQPVVVIDTRTLARQPIWSELDSNPTDPGKVDLLIRPARNLTEGTRYIVALRNLRNAGGAIIPAGPAFQVYRDHQPATAAAPESRRAHMEDIFTALGAAGIGRSDLYLAWDFTVASRRSLTGRMLHIRDDAFAQLGDTNLADLTVQGSSPQYSISSTTDYAPCAASGCQSGQDSQVARDVKGTVTVPCYLAPPGCTSTGNTGFYYGASTSPDALPQQAPQSTYPATFECIIPRSAVDGAQVAPARPSLYGHGLFGSAGEVHAGNVKAMANEHDMVFCATAWVGMATEDVPNAVVALGDLSHISSLFDRLQQGILNFLFVGRALIHPQGLAADPAFQFTRGGVTRSVIDTTRLFYDGNSQGGIAGGALTAVAPDFDRAVLGVPGMNYSTLLQRSSDFGTYAQVWYRTYNDEAQRQLLFSLVQMLWDRGEADGYAAHMTTDPLPNTPAHTVLMHEAVGDHQVANVAAEVEARTIGAAVRQPAVDPGRSHEVTPYYGIPAITQYPYPGSAIVPWDIGPERTVDGRQLGTDPDPAANVAPSTGQDPHEAPRSEVCAREQKSDFLRVGGAVVDVCDTTHPYYAWGWTGPAPGAAVPEAPRGGLALLAGGLGALLAWRIGGRRRRGRAAAA